MSIGVTALFAGSSAPAAVTVAGPSKGAKILSPSLDGLQPGPKARVAVRVGPDRRWRVRVNDREGGEEVSERFRKVRPRVWAARLGRRDGLRAGSNRVWLLSRRGSGDWKATGQRFVLGARERDLVSLHGPRGRTAATRARIRIEVPSEPDHLRVSLNGKRVEGELLERREGRHRATLSASHGLRYGKNRLTVRGYDFGGDFEVERLGFQVVRNRPLAAAGRDREMIEGEGLRLNGEASRPSNERKRLRYRWRVVGSPRGSEPRLRRSHSARPKLRTDVHGVYRLRLTVTEAGAGRGQAKAAAGQSSSDQVTVATQPDAPPIGVPIETLVQQPRGTATACPPANGLSTTPGDVPITTPGGVVVGDKYYGNPGAAIQLLVLDAASLECEVNEAYDATPFALGLLAKEVQSLTTQPAKVLAITSSGAQIAQSSAATVNDTLKLIGTEPLSASELVEPFSVIGTLDGALGTASVNPGLHAAENPASPDWPSGRGELISDGALLGFMTLSAEARTGSHLYSFVSPEYVPFTTRDPERGGPCVPPECPPFKLAAPATGGFAVTQLDAGTAGLDAASSEVFPTNGTSDDATAQKALADALGQIAADPRQIVLIQSLGSPAATTPQWSLWKNFDSDINPAQFTGIAAEIEKLGGTADVFNRLDGTMSYSLVGGAGIEGPAAETASKMPVPCIEDATWSACNPPSDIGQVVMQPSPRSPVLLTGVLAKNNAGVLQPVVGGPSGDATDPTDETGLNHRLLQIAYRDPEPFPTVPVDPQYPQANQQALKYVAEVVVGSGYSDPREAYYDPHVINNPWSDNQGKLDEVCYPWQTPLPSDCKVPPDLPEQPTFSSAQLDWLKTQLKTEFGYVAEVQGFLGQPGTSTGSTMQNLFQARSPLVDVGSITKAIENSVDPSNDDDAISEAWQVFAVAFSVANTLFTPEDDTIEGLGLISDGFWLGAAFAPDGDGAGAFSALETQATNLSTALSNQLEHQAAEVSVVAQIIVSDWGKLQAVGVPLQNNDPTWTFDQDQATDSFELSIRQQIYASLIPSVYVAYQLDTAVVKGSNPVGTDPWHYLTGECLGPDYDLPFKSDSKRHSEPRTGAFPMVYDIGGTQSSPTRTAHWWALGTGNLKKGDWQVASAALTDPLFAPPGVKIDTSPGNPGVGMLPAWFWTRTWPGPPHLWDLVVPRPPDSRYLLQC